MTTNVKITNLPTSNGDIVLRHAGTCYLSPKGGTVVDEKKPQALIPPGSALEIGITDHSLVSVIERWPAASQSSGQPDRMKFAAAGVTADNLIGDEIARQDLMWGTVNERADSSKGQLLRAAMAQADAIGRVAARTGDGSHVLPPDSRAQMFEHARMSYYPVDWSGFRDYGSDVANLVVAAAFLRQEIKRRIGKGESTIRKSRDPVSQPYVGDQPYTLTK